MEIIELRIAQETARKLGRPLAGYSARQLSDMYSIMPAHTRHAIVRAPAHIRARILENNLRSIGEQPNPETVAASDIAPVNTEMADRLAALNTF